MDIPQLAADVAKILIPFLTAGAIAAASEMGKQSVVALWEKMKPKIDAKEAAQEAVQDVIKNPEATGHSRKCVCRRAAAKR